MNAPKPLKTKRCKTCKEPFIPFRPLQSVCSPTCAVKAAQTQREKQERRELREAKQRIKPKSQWLREAQYEFNRYIRLRDADQPCVSCQRFHSGQYHAGHYRSIGSCPELRFSELNVHKQCSACNNHLSGNIINYRLALLARFDEALLGWLEGKHEPKHYTIDDIRQIKRKYQLLAKALEQST